MQEEISVFLKYFALNYPAKCHIMWLGAEASRSIPGGRENGYNIQRSAEKTSGRI